MLSTNAWSSTHRACLAVCAAAAAVALVLLAGAQTGLAQQTPTITLTTDPPVDEIVPDDVEDLVKTIIEVKDASGRLIPNVLITVDWEAPAFGPFVSSDIPAVEGTKLQQSTFLATTGRLEMETVYPIRGTYKFEVRAAPGPGSPTQFGPVAKTFEVSVRENPEEPPKFWLLAGGLLVLGLVSGIILGAANRTQAAG